MSSKPGLRMKELIEATGLPKSTILFYLEQGLLPQPVKTSRNMAYYPPECIERLHFIKTVQNSHRLPLQKIKTLISLRDQGQDPEPMANMLGLVFGEQDDNKMNREDFLKATGLSEKIVQEMLDTGLLLPLQEGRFDQQDLIMGIMMTEAMKHGIQLQDMAPFPKLAKQMVAHVMTLHDCVVKNLPLDQKIARTIEMLPAARIGRNYVIERTFQKSVLLDQDEKWLKP
jgi:DNA-binding transcriptional MerR regulator